MSKVAELALPLADYPCHVLTGRQRCDLELILNGSFFPLTNFLNQANYEMVLSHAKLLSGDIWPMPIMLDISEDLVNKLEKNPKLLLRDYLNLPIAILSIQEIWPVDKPYEAQAIYGTQNLEHPGVNYLFNKIEKYYVSGKLDSINPIYNFTYLNYRKNPEELKLAFKNRGWHRVIGFQTRNPMHKAHQAMTEYAANEVDGKILLHPVIGEMVPGDVEPYTRIKCYEWILNYYKENNVYLSLLNLAMRMAGPREALLHSIIRQNYGCTDFIIGRDHAGPKDKTGKSFYGHFEAQEYVSCFKEKLTINIINMDEFVFVKNKNKFMPKKLTLSSDDVCEIAATQLRQLIKNREQPPEWVTYPEIIKEMQKVYLPKDQTGLGILITGLSAAGKSTLARALMDYLTAYDDRKVVLLDGDEVRQQLSPDLGFSASDRKLNIQRIAYMAQKITQQGGIAIIAAIAPYREGRMQCRDLVNQVSNFFEIYLSTPLDTCQKRDPKGLYAKASQGKLTEFTGVDAPYETPIRAEYERDTSELGIRELLREVTDKLAEHQLITQRGE